MSKIAVIIPYFQQRPGLLARALNSIAVQRTAADDRIDVIIVDDSSPHPLARELAGWTGPEKIRLRTVRRPNGGPGAARNTGLELVASDTDAVAFLDSDDVWSPQHLANAMAALGAGADLYFANHARPAIYDSYFGSMGLEAARIGRPVLDQPRLHQLADDKLRLILQHYLAQASTLALRWSRHRDRRFPPELRTAGEDQVYLLALAVGSSKILFSDELDAVCGEGVNVYFGNLSWDVPGCLGRMSDRLSSFHLIDAFVRSHAAHDLATQRFIAEKITSLQRMTAMVSARGLLRRTSGFARETRAMARRDPSFWRWYPRRLLEVGFLIMAGRFEPADE
jgi:succinoglycan biosynthesis protein ExoW